jgi:hypothetical protein
MMMGRTSRVRTWMLVATLCAAAGCGKGADSDGGVALVPLEQFERQEFQQILAVRDRLAKAQQVPVWQVGSREIAAEPEIREGQESEGASLAVIESALGFDADTAPEVRPLVGFVRLSDDHAAMDYAVLSPSPELDGHDFVTLREFLGKGELRAFRIRAKQEEAEEARTLWVGPIRLSDLEAKKSAAPPGLTIETLEEVPIAVYTNGRRLVLVVERQIPNPHRIAASPLAYSTEEVGAVRQAYEKRRTDPQAPVPPLRETRMAMLAP